MWEDPHGCYNLVQLKGSQEVSMESLEKNAQHLWKGEIHIKFRRAHFMARSRKKLQ